MIKRFVIVILTIGVGGTLAGRLRSQTVLDARQPATVVVSLDSRPVELTQPEDGVFFDIRSTGKPERLSWTIGGREEAFLVVDENHNGRVDGGFEVVGGASGPPNGFRKLPRSIDSLE
jgi:hypothetical protein